MPKVVRLFDDRLDEKCRYEAGDTYPREGYEPPAGRIEALSVAKKGKLNKTGKVYLEPDGE